MRRVQGGPNASEDEKKRVRQEVLSNFILFGLMVGVIRICKLLQFRFAMMLKVLSIFSTLHHKQHVKHLRMNCSQRIQAYQGVIVACDEKFYTFFTICRNISVNKMVQ